MKKKNSLRIETSFITEETFILSESKILYDPKDKGIKSQIPWCCDISPDIFEIFRYEKWKKYIRKFVKYNKLCMLK